MALILAAGHGANAADPSGVASINAETVAPPVSLAGRWTGPRHSFGARTTKEGCEGGRCTLTLDFVACGAEWCGIMVNTNEVCGSVATKLSQDAKPDRQNAFNGKLELAKGADPYVIEAWYAPPVDDAASDVASEAAAHLSFVGDTGPELMMFRRSFPFSADLARTGDAKCTLEKATS